MTAHLVRREDLIIVCYTLKSFYPVRVCCSAEVGNMRSGCTISKPPGVGKDCFYSKLAMVADICWPSTRMYVKIHGQKDFN